MKKLTDAHIKNLKGIKNRIALGISHFSDLDVRFLLEVIEYLTATALGKEPNEAP